MRDSKIYNENNGCVYIRLEYIGNFQNIYSKIYNFTDKIYCKLCSRMDYKYIYRKRILKMLDNIFYLMENNNIEFKFNLFDYDLYEVNSVPDMYIIKIKLKKTINNIINKKIDNDNKYSDNIDSDNKYSDNIDSDNIDSDNKYSDNIDSDNKDSNNTDISKINNYDKNIKSITKTMYIFHSYKKMFYYSIR